MPNQEPPYRTYRRSLFAYGKGLPLYEPAVSRNAHEEYQETGVRVGDVGYHKNDGNFIFLFNIFSEYATINTRGIPSDFKPIPLHKDQLDDKKDIRKFVGYTRNGSDIRELRVEAEDPKASVSVGFSLGWQRAHSEGAALILPHGTSNVDYTPTLANLAKNHAIQFYKFAAYLGHEVPAGGLYLISGVTKTKSWHSSTFFDTTGRNFASFKSGVKGFFEVEVLGSTQSFSNALLSPRHSERGLKFENQTLFLRGWKMMLHKKVRRVIFQSLANPGQEDDLEVGNPIKVDGDYKPSRLDRTFEKIEKVGDILILSAMPNVDGPISPRAPSTEAALLTPEVSHYSTNQLGYIPRPQADVDREGGGSGSASPNSRVAVTASSEAEQFITDPVDNPPKPDVSPKNSATDSQDSSNESSTKNEKEKVKKNKRKKGGNKPKRETDRWSGRRGGGGPSGGNTGGSRRGQGGGQGGLGGEGSTKGPGIRGESSGRGGGERQNNRVEGNHGKGKNRSHQHQGAVQKEDSLPPMESDSEDSISSDSEMDHPSDIINQYLHDHYPDCDVFITHDDIWCSVLEEGNGQIPTDEELIGSISQRYIVHKSTNSRACMFVAREVHYNVLPDEFPQNSVPIPLSDPLSLERPIGITAEYALGKAAEEGREAKVRELLSTRGIYVNARDRAGETALHKASQNGHEKVVQLLISSGAKTDALDNAGETALQKASRNRHEGVIRLLTHQAETQRQIDVDASDGRGENTQPEAAQERPATGFWSSVSMPGFVGDWNDSERDEHLNRTLQKHREAETRLRAALDGNFDARDIERVRTADRTNRTAQYTDWYRTSRGSRNAHYQGSYTGQGGRMG